MSNHWPAIGICSQEELVEVIKHAVSLSSSRSEILSEHTHLLTDGSVEVWVHTDSACAVPSFLSPTTLKAIPKKWVEAQDGCPHCTTLHIQVLSATDEPLYPLAVTFGNAVHVRQIIELDSPIELALSAFVENGIVWSSLEAYKYEYPDSKVGPGWFLPLGAYAAMERMRDDKPRAAFYGVVQQVQVKSNPWTGQNYRQLSIECAGITYEAVVQHEILTDVSVGNVVYVECWLCAHYVISK